MNAALIDRLAEALAANRRVGAGPLSVPLPRPLLPAEAEAVQLAALDALGGDFVGYALTGTSEVTRHSLGLSAPICAPIPRGALLEDPRRFQLPRGLIGAQCEIAFTLGRAFPREGETPDRASAGAAVLACRPAIGLLARRALPTAPDDAIAIADFALHCATILGPAAERSSLDDAADWTMTAAIDGNRMVAASGSAIMDGHPVDALVWLGRRLAEHGDMLNAGDVVTTGGWGPILQVLPGQELAAAFSPHGEVRCRFL